MSLSLYAPSNYAGAPRRGLYEPQERSVQKFDHEPGRLQAQAANLLTDKESRQAFQKPTETSRDGLPGLQLTSEDVVASGMQANKGMIDGMNANVDQVSQMLDVNPNADLFQALKDRDRDAALDFAVHNQEFHVQAMNDMNDAAFQQEARLRISGTP